MTGKTLPSLFEILEVLHTTKIRSVTSLNLCLKGTHLRRLYWLFVKK